MTKRPIRSTAMRARAYDLIVSPCICSRAPRLVETGWTYGAAWDGGCLIHYELRCPRWFRRCLRITKCVSKSSPWFRWREDLSDEWNAAVDAARRLPS